MDPIRFFTDEDIYGAIAIALRNSGYDAISTPDAHRMGETDESQLNWATSEQRVLVTFNVGHFTQLHRERLERGRKHSGIVVSIQRPVGDLLRRLLHLAGVFDGEAMCDRLEFLSDW